MKLSAPQQTISNHSARFKVCAAGRRFGKSFLSINELAKFARKPNQRCLYVAPTYRQAKTVIWEELKSQLYSVKWIKKVNESDLTITLVNGSTIAIRSADNKDALRGTKYNFIVLDECAFMGEDVWYSVLRPTLSDTGGSALFITSPDGRNWIYDLWVNANAQEDWAAFSYSTIDGGNVPQEEIDAARRDLDPKRFEQEYEAKFIDTSSVIFYGFTEDNVVVKPVPEMRAPLHIGMDFNIDPMSAVVCYKGANSLHIVDEIEIWSSNTLEMVQEIRKRYGNEKQIYVYPDSSGARRTTNSTGISDHIILQNNGFRVISGKTNPPVGEAITAVNSLLCNTTGERRLTIDPKCKRLRECLIKHTYKPGTRIPDKDSGFDHMTDALRYVTHTLFPLKQLPRDAVMQTRMRSGRMMN